MLIYKLHSIVIVAPQKLHSK